MKYFIGGGIHISAAFTTRAGVPTNPSAVVFKLRSPSGVITTPAVTHDGLGAYSGDFIVTAPGKWEYRWEATGALTAAEEGDLFVHPSDFV